MVHWIAAMLLATTAVDAAPVGTTPDCPVRTGAEAARLSVAATASGAGTALPVGRRATATLASSASVRYPVAPARAPTPDSHGGLLDFTVASAGTYRVSLGSAAWIDVVRDGKPVASSAHGHGAACSDFRKRVDFPLTPGRYMLQIVGSAAPDITLLIDRVP